MNQQSPTPPAPPGPSTPKKGLNPWAWAGIGCGGLLVVVVLSVALLIGWGKRRFNEFQQDMAANPEKAAAEMIVGMNPDLEMISENEDTGEMTIRIKSSGEEVTVSYADISEGRFTVIDGQGNTTSIGQADPSKIPAWVPRYPNMAEQSAVFHQDKSDGIEGVWTFSTNDTPEQVESFFDREISWSTGSGSSSTTFNGIDQREHDYRGEGKELKVISAAAGSGKPTQVTLNYKEATP